MKRIAAITFAALTACGTMVGSSPSGNPSRSASFDPVREPPDDSSRFDALTLALELETTSVPSGGTIHSDLIVRNRTKEAIVDRNCSLSAHRSGLIPRDKPEADLWQQVLVDCGGALNMKPGFSETFTGPEFGAVTMSGEPLPPGSYLAAVDIEGRSERLLTPVEVTDPEDS